MFVIAAAVMALVARPQNVGPVAEHLLAGRLSDDISDFSDEPQIDLECRADGTVVLRRLGLTGVGIDGALSLKVEVKGFDIRIYERLTPGNDPQPAVAATFYLDFIGRERYHVRYESEATSTAASLWLHNVEGNHITRPLLK